MVGCPGFHPPEDGQALADFVLGWNDGVKHENDGKWWFCSIRLGGPSKVLLESEPVFDKLTPGGFRRKDSFLRVEDENVA